MSEELRQKGYMNAAGVVRGDACGDFESFNIGNSTLAQLKKAGVIAPATFHGQSTMRPDGLIVDRRGDRPDVRCVVEYKDLGELTTEGQRHAVFDKVAATYCHILSSTLAVVSDGTKHHWLLVDQAAKTWRGIQREDGYALDAPIDLSTDAGRAQVAATLHQIAEELDPTTAVLQPPVAVNPTRLAEQVWQTIWLASGENPDACLASFVEILIFKFMSDLGLLTSDPSGSRVSFENVRQVPDDTVLKYYFKHVRPEIKRLFPPGSDGTSVINGMVLDPTNKDHSRLFAQILKRFATQSALKRIDPEFKSRIFERFLRESISKKNWGQYFTPRNVVKAIVEMSGIENLPDGSVVADPACGVGGFVLEPLVHRRRFDYRSQTSGALKYVGLDRDQKTIILAKANMLIHLSEVLEKDPAGAPLALAPVLNDTFHSMHTSIIGSLAQMPRDEYDLVMTNPPYVLSGTSTQRAVINSSSSTASYYDLPGAGVENFFMQLIMRGLKPGGRAIVVVPDGLLIRHTEEAIKRHLLETCMLEAVVSLPKDTFYSTPKKTYILSFRKKRSAAEVQATPVFTYLVKDVGETLDAGRFPIAENDLPDMADAFRLFTGSPESFSRMLPARGQVKVFPVEAFKPEEHWLVDRWWPADELRDLGLLEEPETIAPLALAERLTDVGRNLADLASSVTEVPVRASAYTRVSLGDPALFRLNIGNRVLKRDLHGKPKGKVPLYSANVDEPFGYIDESSLTHFDRPSVIWGIDGNFTVAVKDIGVAFDITDHCGRLEVLSDALDPGYCRAALALARAAGFDRTLRPSLKRMKALTVPVPVDEAGSFDVEAQKALAQRYDAVVQGLKEAHAAFSSLVGLEPELLLES